MAKKDPGKPTEREASQVVYSDVKYCGGPPFMWTSVVFRTDQEIDELINALRKLKASEVTNSAEIKHMHLSDQGLNKCSTKEKAEIVFFGPNFNSPCNADEKKERLRWAKEAKILLEGITQAGD